MRVKDRVDGPVEVGRAKAFYDSDFRDGGTIQVVTTISRTSLPTSEPPKSRAEFRTV